MNSYGRLALAALAALIAPPLVPAQNFTPPFTQCPAIGLDTSCAILLVIEAGGSLRVKTDAGQPPFDGIEDTLIGVVNNSPFPVAAIPLTGATAVFDFDGDGLCDSTTPPQGCPFGPTGYEGPGVSFTVNSSTSGAINFSPPLAIGESRYFSLELAIQTLCPDVSVTRLSQGDPGWGCRRYGVYTDPQRCAGGTSAGHTCQTDQDCPGGGMCCVTTCNGGTSAGQPCQVAQNCPGGGACAGNSIRRWGCNLTSLAMIVNAEGGSVTPDALNILLRDNGGYDSGSNVKPFQAASIVRSNLSVPLYYHGQGNGSRDDFSLDQFLCNGDPPMLNVPGHFIVATGQTTTNACNDTYKIADPGFSGRTTLDSYSCTYSSLRLYGHNPTPPNALYVRAHSPVELLLTDPVGRTTGFVPAGNIFTQDIPQSTYTTEFLANDEDPSAPSQPEVKIIEVLEPQEGQYTLRVIGTGEGPFTIEIGRIRDNGQVDESSIIGNASAGSEMTHQIVYSNQGGGPTVACPAPATVECASPSGTTVPLTAQVGDLSGNDLVVTWQVDGTAMQTDNIAASAPPLNATVTFNGTYASGPHTVTVNASDASMTTSCSTTVTVQDTTPPAVTCLVATPVFSLPFPPDHNFRKVGLKTMATDACSGTIPVGVMVFGNEDEESPTGDGPYAAKVFSPDAANIAPGTLRLRDERIATSAGRVYLVVPTATDASGNTGSACCTVVVPHDPKPASVSLIRSQAAAAVAFCANHNGSPPAGYLVVGDGPVIGPKQ